VEWSTRGLFDAAMKLFTSAFGNNASDLAETIGDAVSGASGGFPLRQLPSP